MAAPSPRIVWIDALRVCVAALVVLVHADYLARPDPFTWWPIGIYSIALYATCVPLFFALAGYVGARARARGLVRRALRLLPLLFVHGTLLLLIGVVEEPTLLGQVAVLVRGVWYLYFLSALVQILLVHALLVRFGGEGPRAMRIALIAALACTTVSYLASSASLWLRGADGGELDGQLRSAGSTWAAFYAMGVSLGRSETALGFIARHAGWLAVLGLALAAPLVGEAVAQDVRYGYVSTLQTMASGLPLQVVGTLAVIAVFVRAQAHPRSRWFLGVLAQGGEATMSVYLLHGTFLWILYGLWLRSGPVVHPLEVPVLALLAGGASWVARAIATRLPRPLPWVLAGARPVRDD